MKQFLNVAVICTIALAACTTPFKKAKDGTLYKVISKGGQRLVSGNYMEMNVLTTYKDSVLGSTYEEGAPQIGLYDTANFPPPYKEILKNIHVGDSIVVKTPTDSILAKNMGQAPPPFMKKGQFIIQHYTITNYYTTKEQADSAQKIHFAAIQKKDSILAIEQQVKDSKTIEEYLAKNKLIATKGEKGTYVEILTPGTGNTPDTGSVLMINYTGKSFAGVPFDSNTDSSFQHVEPYPVDMLAPQVVPGWVDGLKMLKKGTKARFYIPSSLGYGKRGSRDKIKPNENLIFDIYVVDIINHTQYAVLMKKKQEEQAAEQKMMQQLQQQMQQQQQGGAPAHK